MEDAPPIWPQRLTREQARAAKEKETLFASALKAKAKAAGWRVADGTIFRQYKDWFVSALPSLLWQRGVIVMPMIKPMGVDRLFWNIVGLPENEALPLSFRANGAWVLRPPTPNTYIALEESDPERLAVEVVAWANSSLTAVDKKSLEALISDIENLGALRSRFAALEVCLQLMRGDSVRALEVIHGQAAGESAGFVSGESSFLDQAEAWIATQRSLARAH